MHQRRVADDPPALLLEPLVGLDGGAQRRPRQIGEMPLIALAKGHGVFGEPCKIALQRLAVATRIEV